MSGDTKTIAHVKAGTKIYLENGDMHKILAWYNVLGRPLTEDETQSCLDGLAMIIAEDCKFSISIGSIDDPDIVGDKDTVHLTMNTIEGHDPP